MPRLLLGMHLMRFWLKYISPQVGSRFYQWVEWVLRCLWPLKIHNLEEITRMPKYYIKAREAVERLRTDNAGVVSLEYVILALLVALPILALFNGTGTNTLQGALTSGFTVIQ